MKNPFRTRAKFIPAKGFDRYEVQYRKWWQLCYRPLKGRRYPWVCTKAKAQEVVANINNGIYKL